MLVSVPDDDNVIVKNKGVEIAIICDDETLAVALKVCKMSSVLGISCAVLEIRKGDIVGSKVIAFYEKIVSVFAFFNEELKEKVEPLLKEKVEIRTISGEGPEDVVTSIIDIIAKKSTKNLRNDVSLMQEMKETLIKY